MSSSANLKNVLWRFCIERKPKADSHAASAILAKLVNSIIPEASAEAYN